MLTFGVLDVQELRWVSGSGKTRTIVEVIPDLKNSIEIIFFEDQFIIHAALVFPT